MGRIGAFGAVFALLAAVVVGGFMVVQGFGLQATTSGLSGGLPRFFAALGPILLILVAIVAIAALGAALYAVTQR